MTPDPNMEIPTEEVKNVGRSPQSPSIPVSPSNPDVPIGEVKDSRPTNPPTSPLWPSSPPESAPPTYPPPPFSPPGPLAEPSEGPPPSRGPNPITTLSPPPAPAAEPSPVSNTDISASEARLAEQRGRLEDAKRALAEEEAKHADMVRAHEELTKVKRDPANFVGLDYGKSGDYSYIERDNHERQRTILVGHITYEHVAEDGDGVWLYRHMA